MIATTQPSTLAHATSAGYGEWQTAVPKPSNMGNVIGIRFDVQSASIAA